MILILMFFLCFAQGVTAQIAIPGVDQARNSSFETISQCPTNQAGILNVSSWELSGVLGISAEDPFYPVYFHDCSPVSDYQVPANLYGAALPVDGSGYAMIKAFDKDHYNSRTFLIGEVVNSIPPGEVSFEFNVSLALSSNWIVKGIGIKFYSIEPQMGISAGDGSSYQISTAINNPGSWANISSTITSPDSVKYFAIGVFDDDVNLAPIQLRPGNSPTLIYVDDVCVSSGMLGCGTVASTPDPITPLPISPTFGSYCRISNPTGQAVNVSDITGKTVFWSQEERISFENLPEGLYLLQQVTPEGVRIGRFLRLP